MVESMSSTNNMPLWLKSLFSEEFFNACGFHKNEKKNERNLFCMDCCVGICPHDKLHRSHHLLQIRKYMYQDVIRVEDVGKLIKCSSIQPYISNSAKVVLLHPRQPLSQTKVCRSTSGNRCGSCNIALQEKYHFCSIFCKITNEISSGEMMSENLHESEVSSSPEPSSEDGLMTPESVLEPFASLRTSSSSSVSRPVDCWAFLSTATTEIVKKKRTPKPTVLAAATASNTNTGTSQSLQLLGNRRKEVPRRSPFY